MELDGARTVVAGATGVLGGDIARALHREGARLALAGRNPGRLAALAAELDGAPTFAFDARDRAGARAVVERAADGLGGLDVLVVAIGVAAFGPGVDEDDEITERLLAVNTAAPMALVRAAMSRMSAGGGRRAHRDPGRLPDGRDGRLLGQQGGAVGVADRAAPRAATARRVDLRHPAAAHRDRAGRARDRRDRAADEGRRRPRTRSST